MKRFYRIEHEGFRESPVLGQLIGATGGASGPPAAYGPSARDWLAVHSTSDETHEAVVAFAEKRQPRFEELRAMQAAGGRSCGRCGARSLATRTPRRR